MNFIQSLGLLGWSLIFVAIACAILVARRQVLGKGEAAAKIQQAKSTLNAPMSSGGGLGGNL